MNKLVKRLSCLALACFTAFPLVACGDDDNGGTTAGQKNNPETQPLVLSTDALDGKFNPFYATSATDVTIAAQTQISMLSLDSSGNIVCGEDEATVALDYKVTMYDTQYATATNKGNVTTDASKAERTEYEFVIKNGIKYSDGDDLTIDDVLFNLYVYLDPLYMGSSTIYSTKIQGLTAYRTQTPDASNDGSSSNVKENFYNQADQRIRYVMDKYNARPGQYETGYANQSAAVQATIDADFAKAKELFREEVESDWTANFGSLESYENEYSFQYDWEVYYLNAGLVNIEYKTTSNGTKEAMKNDDGKYITTLDVESADYEGVGALYIANMNAALAGLEVGSNEYYEAMRQEAVQTVYEYYVNEDLNIIKEEVLLYWATADALREEIAATLLDEHYKSLTDKVTSISGITTYKTSSFDGGKMGSKLDGEHDVLKIVIDDIDPKAIYNFAFSVAPMHYYGDGNSAVGGKYDDYYKNANRTTNFGVAFGEKDFFDKVLQDSEKTGFPVGAGAYQAWSRDENATKNADNFWDNNIVYYKRNEYFYTVGDGLNNAKIKYLRYQVISSSQLMNALESGTVHFGTPNASVSNMAELQGYRDKLSWDYYETNGYGYVGINAKYVPDIKIRRIIMKTMKTQYAIDYYGELARPLYRSMSLTSDYYPVDASGKQILSAYEGVSTNMYAGDLTYYGDQNNTQKDDSKYMVDTIKAELDALGYKAGSDGVRVNSQGYKLKYTFTIAGGTNDHPAYLMMDEAAKILNQCGFEITVKTDPNALIKLSTGELQVWAAAWQSSIDPDMYQVYHKDSTATSVKNWGYDAILKAGNETKYATEIEIINELSELIEEGRESLNPVERRTTYTEALDLVMELAVELPVYQRMDLFVYDKNLIDANTLNQNASTNSGLLDRIWEVNYL